MKLDILAFGAHPDDVEIGCGGTLALQAASGNSIGIVDLTRGELGTRGNVALRQEEAEEARKILNAKVRLNLGFEDGFFQNDRQHQIAIVRVIRAFKPDIVIASAINDRHPDHGKSAKLIADAAFLSGLSKIETEYEGKMQPPWRPGLVCHYIQALRMEPDFLVDISDFFEIKMRAILAHKSQFYHPSSNEPETFISKPAFLEFIKARAFELGHVSGVSYAEGFTLTGKPVISNLFSLKQG